MPTPRLASSLALVSLALALPASTALAQDRGSVNPKPLPPLENPDAPSTPAKALFGRVTHPAAGPAQIYGFYAKGCFSGGEALPMDGANWQVMRPSRNRMWGTPYLVDFVERLAGKAARVGWPGLLVGDMAQPRGGPMITGHASHQIGIDADVWLTPMPDHRMSRAEREETSATDMVRAIRREVLDKIVAGIPVKRLGTPQDIASMVSWVASEESGFATGADFSVNGGLHMG